MLEKPDLADEIIVAALQKSYAIVISRLHFLPIGNDATAWVYQVKTEDAVYFLKVKQGEVVPASVGVPHWLKEQGIAQVVAPLSTRDGELWVQVDSFSLILYPFVAGRTGMEQGMTPSQWIELGRVLKRIHTTRLASRLAAQVPRETFVPAWAERAKRLHRRVLTEKFTDYYAQALAEFWRARQAEIAQIVARTEEIGHELQTRSLPFVLCHADIHTANVLLDADGDLFIVDWDQPIHAPKERDLMFVPDMHAAHFFQGYGETEVDRLAIAYYRYEWVVQEIGDFGARIFASPTFGEKTRVDSLRGFRQLFDPGDVVEAAYRSL